MKLETMQKICDESQKNMGCINCKLFTPMLEKGCLKNHRYEIVEQYKKYITEKNEIMAEKTMNDYKDLERKVLSSE